MAATKDTVKVQLNLKAGNDLFNVYASNARELVALVDEVAEVAPAIAQRFGIKSSAPAPATPTVAGTADAAAEADAGESAPTPEAISPTASAPTSEDGEALSPREKARARLQGKEKS